MKKRNLALVAALAPILAACSTYVETVKNNPPADNTAFTSALHQGYVKLAEMEFAEYDRGDGYAFAKRAAVISEGGTVYPEEIGARELPVDRVNVLAAARERLMKALNSSAAQTHPKELADAQVAFDCWMQEQEENKQQEHIDACQADFIIAMNRIPVEQPKPVVAPAPTPAPEPTPEPVVEKKPEPKPEHVLPALPQDMKVYFDFDQSVIKASEQSVLNDVRDYLNTAPAKTVKLIAHTDRAGDVEYNTRLAEKRAAAVKLALIDMGVEPGKVFVDVKGENSPVVPTEDGVRELKNRVVQFVFSYM